MISRRNFVANVIKLLDKPTTFVWGTSGEIISEHTILKAVVDYPKRYDSALIAKLYALIGTDTRCFECTGVVKNAGHVHSTLTADEMFARCQEKGLIEQLPELPGIIVHMSGHCGVYIGNGEVVEATYNPLFGFGVLKTKLSDRDWICWYKCHWVDYEEE